MEQCIPYCPAEGPAQRAVSARDEHAILIKFDWLHHESSALPVIWVADPICDGRKIGDPQLHASPLRKFLVG